MTAHELMEKAARAATSAKLLLNSGDVDGACNRAYYAMFDAARAALIASKATAKPEEVKTHSGLLSAFSLHLVKTNRVPVEWGRALNRVAEIRLIADYTEDVIELEKATWTVERAQAFVDFIRTSFLSPEPHANPDHDSQSLGP